MTEQSKPIGILFVHGIGTEKQGETLLGYSEPVFKWIARWLKTGNGMAATGSPAESIEVTNTDLYPEDGVPAHSRWVMYLRDGENNLQDTHWIAAESWWAETIVASNWRQTIDWAKQVVPSIVFFQISNFVRRAFRSQEREFLLPILLPIYGLPYMVFGILLLLLLHIVALALGILALFQIILPVGWLRSAVQSIQVILSHWAGDVFLILNSPIQRSAMLSKLKKDLEWMKKECSQIVIVAHSQGAALSYQILQEDQSQQIKGLVTLGSAIKLFKKIDSLQEKGLQKRLALLINILLLVLVSAAVLAFIFKGLWPLMILFIIGFVIIGGAVKALDPDRSWDPIGGGTSIGRPGFMWRDLYASNDPAPDGRLSPNPPAFLESSQVYNQANLVLDHTTYWENFDEFVSAVAVFLSKVTKTNFVNEENGEVSIVRAAMARRKLRFRYLIGSRTVANVCAIALLLTLWTYLPLFGSDILERTQQATGRFPFMNWTDRISPVLLGGIIIAAIPLVWHLLTGWLWRRWQARDTEKLFRREAYESGGWPVRFMILMTSVLFLGTVKFVSGPYRISIEQAGLETTASTLVYLLVFAVAVISIFVIGARLLPIRIPWKTDMETWSLPMVGLRALERSLGLGVEEEGDMPPAPPWAVAVMGMVGVIWPWVPVVLSSILILVFWAPDPMNDWQSAAFTFAALILALWNTRAFLRAEHSSMMEKIYLVAIGVSLLVYTIWLLT